MAAYATYLRYNWQTLLHEALGQLVVVAVAIGIAVAVATLLGVSTARRSWLAEPLLGMASAALTLPSLALFGLMIPVLGLGMGPTVAVLVVYATMPLLRNVITGLRSIDPAVLEAATGMGMSGLRRLVGVELPCAWPVILAGLRFSTMMIIGVATVGAYVGGPGLGTTLFNGLEEIGSPAALPEVVVATCLVILLGLAVDGVLAAIGRATVSRGISGARAA
jgi:osmoprotectant transport system permease protein